MVERIGAMSDVFDFSLEVDDMTMSPTLIAVEKTGGDEHKYRMSISEMLGDSPRLTDILTELSVRRREILLGDMGI
jgi:hypothetical protein